MDCADEYTQKGLPACTGFQANCQNAMCLKEIRGTGANIEYSRTNEILFRKTSLFFTARSMALANSMRICTVCAVSACVDWKLFV